MANMETQTTKLGDRQWKISIMIGSRKKILIPH